MVQEVNMYSLINASTGGEGAVFLGEEEEWKVKDQSVSLSSGGGV